MDIRKISNLVGKRVNSILLRGRINHGTEEGTDKTEKDAMMSKRELKKLQKTFIKLADGNFNEYGHLHVVYANLGLFIADDFVMYQPWASATCMWFSLVNDARPQDIERIARDYDEIVEAIKEASSKQKQRNDKEKDKMNSAIDKLKRVMK